MEKESHAPGLRGIDFNGVPEGSFLFRSSGSSGEPKWIVHGKVGILASARAVNDWLGVGKDSVWGLALPLFHVGGFGIVARSHEAGCRMAHFAGGWEAGRFAGWLESEGVTHTSLVPSQVFDLVKGDLRAPRDLKAVVVGGGKLEEGLGRAARALGWPVLASYGMTEAGSQVATQSPSGLNKTYGEVPMEILPIWRVKEDGGVLLLEGESLFVGTAIRLGSGFQFVPREEGYFRTSDRVEIEGNVLRPIGRCDRVVKILGELVDLEEIEKKFLRIADGRAGIGRFAVVAVGDERRGVSLIAVFAREYAGMTEDFETYQEGAGGLNRFRELMVVDQFPLSELGKIKRWELQLQVEERCEGRLS